MNQITIGVESLSEEARALAERVAYQYSTENLKRGKNHGKENNDRR